MTEILLAAAALGGLGLLFGGLLGVAAKAFYIEPDVRAEKIAELLPGANCGGCGFAGCAAMAAALAEGRTVPTGCAVLKAEQLQAISELMGIEAEPVTKRVAKVFCNGTCDMITEKCAYNGIQDCVAAYRCGGGEKACMYGCSGYGSCVRACRFGAMHLDGGVARVDSEACTACGRCVAVCPKGLIQLVPAEQRTFVMCRSEERGAALKTVCRAGCIGCRICEKICPKDAIVVKNNRAVIHYELCINCGLCAEKCPQNVIEYTKKK